MHKENNCNTGPPYINTV